MDTERLWAPNRLNFQSAAQFVRLLHSANSDEVRYEIRFDRVGRIEPFAMLYLASELQRFKSRLGDRFRIGGHDHMTYADHMGFFRAFGVESARKHRPSGNQRYLPINIRSTRSICDEAATKGLEVGAVIEGMCEEIAMVLAQASSGRVYDAMVYSFREMIRNVVEHSGARQLAFCAQYWPMYNRVEAALIDRGRGIRRSLSANPYLSIEEDRQALALALMPGISGVAYKGGKKQRGDWANSGFGLYMTSRLCRKGGSFFIASGDAGVYLSEQKKRELETPFHGTAVRLSLEVDRIAMLKEELSRFRDEAREFASTHRLGKTLNASVASLMLRSDFNLEKERRGAGYV